MGLEPLADLADLRRIAVAILRLSRYHEKSNPTGRPCFLSLQRSLVRVISFNPLRAIPYVACVQLLWVQGDRLRRYDE